MYELIQISKLNDFIFCPYSIYLHSIYDSFKKSVYEETPQLSGTIAHKSIDKGSYSTSKEILQGLPIYSSRYNLIGKIDLYDKKKFHLIERKKKVKQIYDGYKYQLYAEYFCLIEVGYKVEKLSIHSLSDNKMYQIGIPKQSDVLEFESLLKRIWNFDPTRDKVNVSKSKCKNCIYRQLCENSKC